VIRKAYLLRNNLHKSRLFLDNRKSKGKVPTSVWELISNKLNDPNFAPTTESLNDVSVPATEYQFSEVIHHSLVADMKPATPDKCKEQFASMNVMLTRVITAWTQSGQGDGGKMYKKVQKILRRNENKEEEEETSSHGDEDDNSDTSSSSDEDDDDDNHVGPLCPRNKEDGGVKLSEKTSFVNGKQLYILYLWQMVENYDLLQTSLQKINSKYCGGDGADVPSIFLVDDDSSTAGGEEGGRQEEGGAPPLISTTSPHTTTTPISLSTTANNNRQHGCSSTSSLSTTRKKRQKKQGVGSHQDDADTTLATTTIASLPGSFASAAKVTTTDAVRESFQGIVGTLNGIGSSNAVNNRLHSQKELNLLRLEKLKYQRELAQLLQTFQEQQTLENIDTEAVEGMKLEIDCLKSVVKELEDSLTIQTAVHDQTFPSSPPSSSLLHSSSLRGGGGIEDKDMTPRRLDSGYDN